MATTMTTQNKCITVKNLVDMLLTPQITSLIIYTNRIILQECMATNLHPSLYYTYVKAFSVCNNTLYILLDNGS